MDSPGLDVEDRAVLVHMAVLHAIPLVAVARSRAQTLTPPAGCGTRCTVWTLECPVVIPTLASVSSQGQPICPEAGVLATSLPQALTPELSKACMDPEGDQQGCPTPAAWGPFPGHVGHVRHGSDAPATCKAVSGETQGWGGGCS